MAKGYATALATKNTFFSVRLQGKGSPAREKIRPESAVNRGWEGVSG
jgi:hypothetical protein